MNEWQHTPVLCREVIEFLRVGTDSVILDGTVGGGAHARAIFENTQGPRHYIGLDADEDALAQARRTLAAYGDRVTLVQRNFADLEEVLGQLEIARVDAVLFDIGVSSYQLDSPERGFSFREDGPLDMRMDRSQRVTAADIVNTAREQELARILYEYGEERFSRKIARAIVAERRRGRISSTRRLSEIIEWAVHYRSGQRLHPATRAFQALRIAVNDELRNLARGLESAVRCLAPHGRLCAIAFHSLEDRIVKNTFREYARAGVLDVLTRKPVVPGAHEIAENSRSRSAKLRAAERTERV